MMPQQIDTEKPVTGTSGDDHIDQSDATGSQQINSGDGSDTVIGSYYADRVNAGDGDDIVTGAEGDDELFGNDGTDTAVYRGSVLDFMWADGRANSLVVTDLNTSDGDEGTDTLKHFELLQFDDYTFDLQGPNAAHVVASDQTGDEDNSLSFSVKAWDFDGGEVSIQSMTVTGAGAISLQSSMAAASGMGSGKEFMLEFDPGDHYQYLAVGETATEEVELVISDGQGNLTTKTFQLTIEGRNDAPVIGGVTYDPGSLKEDETLMVSGMVNATDVDASDTLSYGLPDGPAGAYGSLTLDPATGAWSYDLDNAHPAVQALAVGESLLDEFLVEVSDGNGGTDTTTISLSIAGTNDAPEITSIQYDDTSVQEDLALTAAGQVLATDIDATDTLAFALTGSAGSYGTLVIDGSTGAWEYALDNAHPAVQALGVGESMMESIEIEVSDGNGGMDTATVDIEILGNNDDPTINLITYDTTTLQEDGTLVSGGMVSASDVDSNDTLSYSAIGSTGVTQTATVGLGFGPPQTTHVAFGTYGNLSINDDSGAWRYSLDNDSAAVQSLGAGEVVIESFTIEVSDGNGGLATDTITLTIEGANEGPQAPGRILLSGGDLTSHDASQMTARGFTVDVVSASQLEHTDLSAYQGIWLSWDTTFSNSTGLLDDNLRAFVQGGGNVLAEVFASNADELLTDDAFIFGGGHHDGVDVVDGSFKTLTDGLTDALMSGWNNSAHYTFTGIGSFTGVMKVSSTPDPNDWATIAKEVGNGNIVLTTMDPSWHHTSGGYNFAENAMILA